MNNGSADNFTKERMPSPKVKEEEKVYVRDDGITIALTMEQKTNLDIEESHQKQAEAAASANYIQIKRLQRRISDEKANYMQRRLTINQIELVTMHKKVVSMEETLQRKMKTLKIEKPNIKDLSQVQEFVDKIL